VASFMSEPDPWGSAVGFLQQLRIQTMMSAQNNMQNMQMCGMGMMGGMGGMGGMMGGGMGGMGQGPPPPPIEGRSEDVKYIACAACKAAVRRASYVASKTRKEYQNRAPTEEEFLTKLEGICDTTKEDGEWIQQYDMVEKDDQTIELKRMSQPGDCGVECKTMGLACTAAMSEAETDLAEAFYNNEKTSKAELEALACGSVCAKPPPKTPESRPVGEAFLPKLKPPPPPPPEAPTKGKKKKKKKKAKSSKKDEM